MNQNIDPDNQVVKRVDVKRATHYAAFFMRRIQPVLDNYFGDPKTTIVGDLWSGSFKNESDESLLYVAMSLSSSSHYRLP